MMLQLIPLLIALCIGFACGYGVRELKSHRRSTAEQKQRRYGEDERQPGCFGLETKEAKIGRAAAQ